MSDDTESDAGPSWTLHLGDCLDPVTGLASLGDKSIDVTICDPPYEAEAHTLQRRTTKGSRERVAAVEPLSFAPISEEERARAGREIARVTKRWMLVFCQIEAAMKWRAALEAGGAIYKRTCLWIKPDGMPQLTGDRPGMGYESIVICHAPGASHWNGGGRHGVFTFGKQPDGRLKSQPHPTTKPDPLMECLVQLFSDHGESVLDPFAGSGSTGVAAIRLGRRFIGWEKDPKYHEIAVRRLSAAHEQLDFFATPKESAG